MRAVTPSPPSLLFLRGAVLARLAADTAWVSLIAMTWTLGYVLAIKRLPFSKGEQSGLTSSGGTVPLLCALLPRAVNRMYTRADTTLAMVSSTRVSERDSE